MSRCELGFDDLFRMAHGRAWTEAEERSFRDMSQPDRNDRVKSWAKRAGGIMTEERVGTDGSTYTAFWVDPEVPGVGGDS